MPIPIFDDTTPNEVEVDYFKQTKKKICYKCGLKFCICNKNILNSKDLYSREKK